MDQILQAAGTVLATALIALVTKGFQVAQAYADNLIQHRLGVGAARIAGDIAATVAGDPGVQAATGTMLEIGIEEMRQRFPDTAGKLPDHVLVGMIRGELGKLGQGVAP